MSPDIKPPTMKFDSPLDWVSQEHLDATFQALLEMSDLEFVYVQEEELILDLILLEIGINE